MTSVNEMNAYERGKKEGREEVVDKILELDDCWIVPKGQEVKFTIENSVRVEGKVSGYLAKKI